MPQGIGLLLTDELPGSMLHEEGSGQLINYHREATMTMNYIIQVLPLTWPMAQGVGMNNAVPPFVSH